MSVDNSSCYFLLLVVIFLLSTDHVAYGANKDPDIKVLDLDYKSSRPLEIIGEETKTIYISCRIDSPDQFKWKWKHNGEDIITPPPYHIPWKLGSVLMVRPLLKKRTDGKYNCIANKIGSRSSAPIIGTVHVSVKKGNELTSDFPQIRKQPKDVRTRRISVDFNCQVSGKPPVNIVWYQNRKPIIFNSIYKVSNVAYGNNLFASNLNIKNTTAASHGSYQCVATNDIGQVVSSYAHILFGKFRKKRLIRSVIPGPIDKSSIRTQCLEKGTWAMGISWNIPANREAIKYYIVKISDSLSMDPFRVFVFNTTENTFTFQKSEGFEASKDDLPIRYQVSVDTFPSPGSNTVVVNIGACPRLGKLSEWGSWGECNDCICKKGKNYCYGKKHRTQKCLSIHDKTKELEDYDCPAVEVAKTRKDCICVDKVKVESTPFIQRDSGSTKVRYEFILAGVCGAFVVIAVIVFVMRNRKYQHQHTLIPSIGQTKVYVSYLTQPHKEERLLNLIQFISDFDVHCIIDLLCQVEINNSGGLPNWLPSKLTNSDKILVVLSKTYVKALNSIDSGLDLVPDKVCKVHTEFNLIKTIMYHSCQRTPQLVILLDGVKKEEIPDVFRGRHHCLYPKKFEMEDEGCRNLMGLLLDEEPLQIVTKKKFEV